MIYLKNSKIKAGSLQEIAKVFQDLLHLEDTIDQEKEHFYVMHLDAKSRVKMVELVSMGSISASIVHPRETFRRAVAEGAVSILVAHNHPSGEVEPSSEDTKVTKILFDAGGILGIPLQDHIIFSTASDKVFSFQNNKEVSMHEI
jgi:DNA repair protein RadC